MSREYSKTVQNFNEEKELIAKISGKITQLRKQKGISLEKLAYENGISKGNLSDIEKGFCNPTLMTLLKIAKGLDIDIKTLFD